MSRLATLAALLLASVCLSAKPAAAKASTVCPRGSYELQYKVKQNRFYTDRFANVMLAKVQRDVTRELRQRKVIYLCSPVYTRVLKGCFHALETRNRKIITGIFQFGYKVHFKCKGGKSKYFRVVSWATANRKGQLLRGKADIKALSAKSF